MEDGQGFVEGKESRSVGSTKQEMDEGYGEGESWMMLEWTSKCFGSFAMMQRISHLQAGLGSLQA